MTAPRDTEALNAERPEEPIDPDVMVEGVDYVIVTGNWPASITLDDLARLRADLDEERKRVDLWQRANAELARERDEARAAVARVEALHAPKRMHPEFRFAPWCAECTTGITTFGSDGPSTHRVSWPCPTAKALGMVDPLDPTLATPDTVRVEPSTAGLTEALRVDG